MNYALAFRVAVGLAAVAAVVPASAQSDVYGGAYVSGVYSSSTYFLDDDELETSGFAARGYVGVRLGPEGRQTRFEAASRYRLYTARGRNDRWSNSIEAEQRFGIGEDWTFSLEGRAITNLSTLEARSADQLTGLAHVIYRPSTVHRLRITGAYRHRYYDDSESRSSAPFVEADYRYRLGRYNYIDLDVRNEWVDSTNDLLDYKRLRLGAYYTHPIGRSTRVRAGVVHRRWSWDERTAPGDERLRQRLLVPQLRLTQELKNDVNLELDYRRVIGRSNDESLERDGNRVAATVRARF